MADMRGERTVALLRTTLLGLLQEKPFEKVTVAEVVRTAGLSKKAFYNHYDNIIDLAIDCFFSPVSFDFPTSWSRDEYVVAYLEESTKLAAFGRDNPNLSRAIMLNAGRSPYFDRVEHLGGMDRLLNFFKRNEYQGFSACITPEVLVHYMVKGCFGLALEWLREGFSDDPAVVAKRGLLLNIHCSSLITGEVLDPETVALIENWQPLSTRNAPPEDDAQ